MGDEVRILLQVLPLAVGIRNMAQTTRWAYVNPAMCRLLGYETPEELIELDPLSSIADASHRAQAEEQRRRLLAGEQVGFHLGRWRRRDGAVVPVEVTAAVIDFEGARSVMIVGRDLVERTELRKRLAIAEHMASLGTLAAGIAHEINNPLTYVLLGLEQTSRELRALADVLSDDRVHALVRKVDDSREGAARIQEISGSLRSMSRIDADERTLLDLREVLDFAIGIVKHQIEHRARLVRRLVAVPLVRANRGRLQQVFVNLLANAAQAIPVGRAADNEITLTTSVANDGGIVVEVRDTGEGIAPDVLPRIFDAFFTTKDVGDGTGLGLAICHGIVTGLGGTITAANGEPRGAVFRVVLPAAVATDDLPPGRGGAVPARMPGVRGRVLIVDDDERVADMCRMALHQHFDAIVVGSVGAALDLLRASDPFDAILCDLMMPVQTGMDLHAQVGRSHPHLRDRIVFMTGGAFTESTRAFLDSVPNPRVEKPFTIDDLVAAVCSCVPA